MKPVIIIPARYNSRRLPGKPLIKINGIPMIQRVYENCQKVFPTYVATDDFRIASLINSIGGKVIMTSSEWLNGTERCAEAARVLEKEGFDFDVVFNVQGDLPYFSTTLLTNLMESIKRPEGSIHTLVTPFDENQCLDNPNVVKVFLTRGNRALYFSRHPITYERYFKHIGMYVFTKEALQEIVKSPPTNLEKHLELEQVRWMEAGYQIYCSIVEDNPVSVDTIEDVNYLNNEHHV